MKHFVLTNKPKVSIIVPMYNAEKYVAQTLDSLIKQTLPNIEIIVVNDGSTDNSRRVVEHFFFDRRLRYLEKPNGGTGSALNVGHEHALGEYATWCSADNIYFPNFAATLCAALEVGKMQERRPELVYSDFCFMAEDGRKIRDVLHKKPQRGVDLIEGYDVGMSFMYTMDLWRKTGPYWNKICEDFDFAVRAAQHTDFALVNAVLAAFRVHGGQITGSRAAEEKAVADECKALARKLFGDRGEPERTLAE